MGFAASLGYPSLWHSDMHAVTRKTLSFTFNTCWGFKILWRPRAADGAWISCCGRRPIRQLEAPRRARTLSPPRGTVV